MMLLPSAMCDSASCSHTGALRVRGVLPELRQHPAAANPVRPSEQDAAQALQMPPSHQQQQRRAAVHVDCRIAPCMHQHHPIQLVRPC
jgi:hypothetical protein